jgi:hypothetical protein
MTNALRTAPDSPFTSPRSVHKTHTRRVSGTQLRGAVSMHAMEDFGLVCHACATVTIFSADASHPLACSRCGNGLRAPLAG